MAMTTNRQFVKLFQIASIGISFVSNIVLTFEAKSLYHIELLLNTILNNNRLIILHTTDTDAKRMEYLPVINQ